jgi:hypothetical protein
MRAFHTLEKVVDVNLLAFLLLGRALSALLEGLVDKALEGLQSQLLLVGVAEGICINLFACK